mmetsp:Transcript_19766/g.35841  ORF Transcript_19766/g.35841 Transcript_19766/m.35841 type:complete len:386 (-) Transcript_19766:87-1244(-)
MSVPAQLAAAQRTLEKLLFTLRLEEGATEDTETEVFLEPSVLGEDVDLAFVEEQDIRLAWDAVEMQPSTDESYAPVSRALLKEDAWSDAVADTTLEPPRAMYNESAMAASRGCLDDAAKTLQSLLQVLQDDRSDFDGPPPDLLLSPPTLRSASERTYSEPPAEATLRSAPPKDSGLRGGTSNTAAAVAAGRAASPPQARAEVLRPPADLDSGSRLAPQPAPAKADPVPRQKQAPPAECGNLEPSSGNKADTRQEVRPVGFGQNPAPLPRSGRGNLEQSSIKGSFDLFDRNGDGVIACGELYEVLPILDPASWTEDKVTQFLKGADKNRDGWLQYEEFEACVLNFNDEAFRRCLIELVSPSSAWSVAFRDSLAKTKKKKAAKKEAS